MKTLLSTPRATPRTAAIPLGVCLSLATAALMFVTAGTAAAATPRVGLGTAESFAVLAGSAVTNTGASRVFGDLGVAPGTAVTGFPPGLVAGGVIHSADAVARQAKSDLTTAYNDAAGRTPPTSVPVELGGRTLTPGVYKAATELGLTGTLTLDAQSDPDAVFIFQAGSTLITASNSSVNLIGGANPCNVYWQVGSSATLGTQTDFVGTIMALASISLQTRARVSGRVLARNGQVSLDTNTITRPNCGPLSSTPPVGVPAPIVIPVPLIPGIPGLPTAITLPPIPGLPGVPSPPRQAPPSAPRVSPPSGIPGGPNAPRISPTPGTPRAPGVPSATRGPQQPGNPNSPTPQGDSRRTAPGDQITEVPMGSVDTGDGSTVAHHRSQVAEHWNAAAICRT